MLATVLRSKTAINVSIQIMDAFVAMRRALASLAPVMARITETERLQLEEKTARLADQKRNEERFDVIFKAMEGEDFPPQKVFYDGQIFDAFEQMKKFVCMTFARELAPFAKIRDAYPRMLIARTRNPETDFEGVRIVNLADWLSGEGGNLQ